MTTRQTILIVEDEKKIADLLADYARAEQFRPIIFYKGDNVLPFVRQEPPDLILLDLMLPGIDGMAICRKVREISKIPIIMLTARVDEIDILSGLQAGADDYILKPFSPREVIARIKAVLRRSTGELSGKAIRIGAFCLEERSHDLKVDGRPLDLTPNEFGIIRLMMNSPGKVFSRKELVKGVQGYDYDGYSRTVDTHIKNLRKKISRSGTQKNPIKSVYGTGYKFNL